MALGVYIHIPFCRRKCLYCDFPSFAGLEHLYESYIAALRREIAGRGGNFSACGVDTVYIGGGTPSVLPGDLLVSVLDCLRLHWQVAPEAEITVEANPGTVDISLLNRLRHAGVNRLSFGVQSFDDAVLQAAGRLHSAAEAAEAVEMAMAADFSNLSLDLMYGLPRQSLAGFRRDLELAVAMPVRHLSVYGLKVEEGTPFARLAAAGKLALPEEEAEEAMYDYAVSFLPAHGYRRYEISNYALSGAESRHNLKYWRYEPYIGLGAGAHSFLDGERTANTDSVAGYIGQLATGQSPVISREISQPPEAMAEYSFLALRTVEGLRYADFYNQFAVEFPSHYAKQIGTLAEQGLLTISPQGIRLTQLGLKYGNIVFAAFLPDKP